MLSPRKIRMLELLDKQVGACKKCEYHQNGVFVPYWTPYSRYAIIGESPSANDIRRNIPFSGASGKIFLEELSRAGFNSQELLIINSVQCDSKGKPSSDQLDACHDHIRKYLKIVNPEKILCLGNYAKYPFTGSYYGVLKERGEFVERNIDDKTVFNILFTIHPAYCIYNEGEGIKMLRNDIMLFKNTVFERRSDWFFDEEEFMI
jgi:DNA polymerase